MKSLIKEIATDCPNGLLVTEGLVLMYISKKISAKLLKKKRKKKKKKVIATHLEAFSASTPLRHPHQSY